MTGRLDYFTSSQSNFHGLSVDQFNTYMNISLKDRYMYCNNPKVACSSILMTLQRFQTRDPHLMHDPLHEIHNRSFSPLLTPLQVPNFEALNNSSEFFKFCFVRNPYDRVISVYLNKVVAERALIGRLSIALDKSADYFSFEEFLDVISSEALPKMDLHYAPQSRVTFQGFVNYDFVGRFENLDKDLNFVLENIGCDISQYSIIINQHYTGKKNYDKYLSPRNCKIICKMYGEDFEKFRYTEQPPATI